MKPIVTVTLNPAIDTACECEEVRPIRKIRTTNERYEAGGGGINAARAINELGGRTLAVYLAGGEPGNHLASLLHDLRLRSHRIDIAQETRVSHVVYERKSGNEFRFTPEGPEVQEDEWRAALDFLDLLDFDYLIASGSLPRGVPEDFYVRVARVVRAKGAKLVVDTSGEALRASFGHGIHFAKPSIGELEGVTGRRLREPGALEQAARELVAGGAADMLAVTLGQDGAVLVTPDATLRLPSPSVPVRSAVGAGDSFVGAMTLALGRGWSVEEAFAYGVAAGAGAVMSAGSALCARADVERLYAEIRKAA